MEFTKEALKKRTNEALGKLLEEKKLRMNVNKMQLVEWVLMNPNGHRAALINPNLPEGEEKDEEPHIEGFHPQARWRE